MVNNGTRRGMDGRNPKLTRLAPGQASRGLHVLRGCSLQDVRWNSQVAGASRIGAREKSRNWPMFVHGILGFERAASLPLARHILLHFNAFSLNLTERCGVIPVSGLSTGSAEDGNSSQNNLSKRDKYLQRILSQHAMTRCATRT